MQEGGKGWEAEGGLAGALASPPSSGRCGSSSQPPLSQQTEQNRSPADRRVRPARGVSRPASLQSQGHQAQPSGPAVFSTVPALPSPPRGPHRPAPPWPLQAPGSLSPIPATPTAASLEAAVCPGKHTFDTPLPCPGLCAPPRGASQPAAAGPGGRQTSPRHSPLRSPSGRRRFPADKPSTELGAVTGLAGPTRPIACGAPCSRGKSGAAPGADATGPVDKPCGKVRSASWSGEAKPQRPPAPDA